MEWKDDRGMAKDLERRTFAYVKVLNRHSPRETGKQGKNLVWILDNLAGI